MREPKRAKKQKISLLATLSGFILILILIGMLLASMNYSNNMAYSMCFLISSLMIIAYVYTNNNLKGIKIVTVQAKTAFAGGDMVFTIGIQNLSSKQRRGLFIMTGQTPKLKFFGPIHIESGHTIDIDISIPAPRRGRYLLSKIAMISMFPFGLFRAHTLFRVQAEYFVFPKPVGFKPIPPAVSHPNDHSEGFHFSGGEDFSGLRPYRPGESQHQIDWKAYARGRPLVIKEFSGGGSWQLWFDWFSLFGANSEERLSQITKWILAADKLGREFGIKLPNGEIAPDSGTLHTLACLKTLALFQLKP